MATNGHSAAAPPIAIPPAGLATIADPTPAELLKLAISRGNIDPDQLTKLLELYERWERNVSRRAFVAALADFKASPPTIHKNAHVHYETRDGDDVDYDHATLDHVCDQVIAGLSAHRIAHRWTVEQGAPPANWIKVTCILTHELGHSESCSLYGAPDQTGGKNAIQAVGSTVTYLERYTLLAATGLAAKNTDTDGRTQVINAESAADPALTAGAAANSFQAHCAAISKARSVDDLHACFAAAYSSAVDRKQHDAYIKIKDKRKKELAQ